MVDLCSLTIPAQAFSVTAAANSSRPTSDPGKSSWAAKISARFRCELAPELVSWFDQGVWDQTGSGEYRQPIHPNELLADAPEVIWPALMPCDLLPICGNTAGDWLCLRIGADNVATEVVQWYHGGGDWIPWGRTLADALVFDALSMSLPGPGRRHAFPAENPRLDSPATRGADHASDPLIGWAAKQVSPDVAALLDGNAGNDELSARLVENGVAEIAVRCELVQDALHQRITDIVDPKLAAAWGVPWEQMVEWTFDAGRIPAERRSEFAKLLKDEFEHQQDWPAAAQQCLAVTQLDANLAWPWEIIGYAAERSGDAEAAMAAYRRASRCSVFTDQSVRLRTHWAADSAAKFSVARMRTLDPKVVADDQYLNLLCIENIQQRRREVCEHWRGLAEQSRRQGRIVQSHQYEMAAGWDLGAEPMKTFGMLLESIADTAAKAGQVARAELARTHRSCLADRYNA